MKRMTIAFALIASAAAAPAFSQELDGTVISTMGETSTVALSPAESGLGNNGIVTATSGQPVELPKERVLLEREKGQVSGEFVTAYTFPSNESAVTPYGAR
ncbi:hypothetical protein M8756_12310 [Lutimaribacter sp. EGI FJ00015]|uniref:Uncharacterized protein n=1 Tax=Lutimaribacter degradans TaxID=2945989 RepID=A0ACC5ZYC7_9RHOB|nr:hypothetical protein [Lutimaribacter sp. EGI FJ00013]MCM2562923.1 hypothetical protein [Lutimaribacter sp. EGI FJ00013]MCO0614091.1 hypothetical protein [Lutimaribacter sp. EGI FJ00015]MCO0636068.1 hypothetical protein [Lutimaribacter sp. EGI FJ00014]